MDANSDVSTRPHPTTHPRRGSDFKLRCGTRWQRYLGMRFESPDFEQEEGVLCPGIKPASGIQVGR